MKNPFISMTTASAIKKAYRKLALECHPDVRQDKEKAAEEFRELTRIYEQAMLQAGREKPERKPDRKPPPPPKEPPQPPPRPSGPITVRVETPEIEKYEFDFFEMGVRTIVVKNPALFEYGGTLIVDFLNMNQSLPSRTFSFKFEIQPKTASGQRFRFKLPLGQAEIMLVSER